MSGPDDLFPGRLHPSGTRGSSAAARLAAPWPATDHLIPPGAESSRPEECPITLSCHRCGTSATLAAHEVTILFLTVHPLFCDAPD